MLLGGGLVIATIAAMVLAGPIPQDPAYHEFADTRSWLGIPNFANVASNLPLVLVGMAGLWFVWRRRSAGADRTFVDRVESRAWMVLFASVLLTGFGSAFYHWHPTTARLAWDRLPMTIVFMSLFAIQVTERIGTWAGNRLLVPLLALGASSVAYWQVTETLGRGDLRLYAAVQYVPMLAIPLMLALFPPRYTRTADLAGVLGCYVAAKVLEVLDAPVFHLLGSTLSGHTLKHLASAVGLWWLLEMIRRRRRVPVQ